MNASPSVPPAPGDASPLEATETLSRRRLLKILAAGSGAIAASTLLPGKWFKPVIETGVLPVHAQTSLVPDPTAEPTMEPVVYGLSGTADPPNYPRVIATVTATGGAPVGGIEVQYIAESTDPELAEPEVYGPYTGMTNSSGVADLGEFAPCENFSFLIWTYRIVISFVDQVTYGNASVVLEDFEVAC